MSLDFDDFNALDLVLGQVHRMLVEDGDTAAASLLPAATFRLRMSDGYYRPDPNDNWTERATDAVLMVDPNLLSEFTTEVRARIWTKLEAVLRGRSRHDVFELIVESSVPPLPDVPADWRENAEHAAAPPPTNQARRERARGGHPERDGLVFGSLAERAVYDALVSLQRDCPQERTFAIAPAAGVKLRDAGVRTPDFLVLGNGRALVIEVDGRHHYGTTRKADDADRDRHWARCDVHTVRIAAHHTEDAAELVKLLREELRRRLWPSR